MSLNTIQGFIPSKIQSVRISYDDCKKYGIKIEDFNKADKNEDGLIDADEFLTEGITELSIFNAFKQLAKSVNGYCEENNNNNNQKNLTLNNTNEISAPKNPNISPAFCGQNCNYLA